MDSRSAIRPTSCMQYIMVTVRLDLYEQYIFVENAAPTMPLQKVDTQQCGGQLLHCCAAQIMAQLSMYCWFVAHLRGLLKDDECYAAAPIEARFACVRVWHIVLSDVAHCVLSSEH
eukprot:TRINITY_DN4456_c2_g1_i1.p1 TRINITY_DN4456_c2_g1~~TRINITY_DN4456_c2_g1_i1.p1  ORF type:complete len:116 (-),score=8.22 TRINITY_DN4456_c2_g1_i1:277-624(-)